LIIIGYFFKLGIAPFHIWVPDIYEGAPTIVILILLTLPKITLFIFLIKLFYFIFYSFLSNLTYIVFISIFCSLLFGTLGAIYQIKLKRFLAYSAIANMDFYL
jgi:NADH-quinone oxidoreductase subunit N